MKKWFIALTLLLFFSGTFAGGERALAEAEIFPVQTFLTDFVTTYSGRKAGSEIEKKAAQFLGEQFLDLGLTPENGKETPSAADYLQEFRLSGNNQYSQNVIGVKKGSGEGSVLIGAHYDVPYENEWSENNTILTSAYGAFSSGTGVTALIMLARELQDQSFDFDIVFCLFGARYQAMAGSRSYLDTHDNWSEILLYADLSSLGDGLNTYLYTDEVSRTHESYIRSLATQTGIEIADSPADKKIRLDAQFLFPYMHDGFDADNLSFLAASVPSVRLFTTNWGEQLKAGYGSWARTLSIADDTPFKLFGSGSAEVNMRNATNLLQTVLSDSRFVGEMQLTRTQTYRYFGWLNGSVVLIIAISVFVVALAVVVLVWLHLRKKAMPKDSPKDIESPFGEEFETKEE